MVVDYTRYRISNDRQEARAMGVRKQVSRSSRAGG